MVRDSGASTRTPQKMVGSVVSQASSTADWETGEIGQLDLSHGGKEDMPSSKARGKGGPSGRNLQGILAPPKGRMDKDEGSRAAANSKGKEENQAPSRSQKQGL